MKYYYRHWAERGKGDIPIIQCRLILHKAHRYYPSVEESLKALVKELRITSEKGFDVTRELSVVVEELRKIQQAGGSNEVSISRRSDLQSSTAQISFIRGL